MSKSWEILTKNIKAILEKKGLTPSDLSRLSGIQRSQIQKILDQSNAPGLLKIEQIAKALDVTPSDLLFDYSQNASVENAVRALDALDPEGMKPAIQGARALLTGDKSIVRQRADEVRSRYMKHDSKKNQR